MTEGNYVRNLSGFSCCRPQAPRPGPVIHWRHSRALRALRRPPHQLGRVADVRLCASPRILPCPPAPLAPSTPVGPGVLMVRSARRFNVRLGLAAASLISHVIPLCLIQTLNLHCWNCNVYEVSRKMTTINYVRNLAGGGVVAAHGCRGQAPPPTGAAFGCCRRGGLVV